MNIIDLLESPGRGRPRDTKGVQSAADQTSLSVIGSGTTEREEKKKPVTMMGMNVKEAVEEAAVKSNFKMPPESLQDKMYRQHQELRKQRGAPSAEEYKQRIAQKQKEIDDLKEGILDRAAPKLPKPRNPANAVLGNKVNAAGKHLDKKRRQELAPKHKHKDPLAEGEVLQFPKSPQDKNVRAKLEQRLLTAFNQIVDYDDNGIDILEKNAPLYSKLFDKYDTEDATLDPEQAMARNEPIEVVAQVVKEVEHIAKNIHEYLDNMWGDTFNESSVDEGWKDAVASAALAGSLALGGMAHASEPVVGQGQSQNMQMAVDMAKMNAKIKYMKTIYGDNFQDKQMPDYHWGKVDLKPGKDGGYQASVPLIVDAETQNESLRPGERHHFETDPVTGKRVYKGIRGDQQDAPQRAKDDPAARADSLAKAQAAYDRKMTEQEVDEHIGKVKDGYRLYSHKGKNLGTFDSKAGAEKHEREVQYFKHKNMEEGIVGTVSFPDDEGTHTGNQPQVSLGGTFAKRPEVKEGSLVKVDGLTGVWRVERIRGDAADVTEEIPNTSKSTRVPVKDCRVWTNKLVKEQDMEEGWKGKVAGAALAGAAALGGGHADAQQIDLPGPQVVYVAHVQAEVDGRVVDKTINLGSKYQSQQQAQEDLENYLESRGIYRYRIDIDEKYNQPYYGQRQSQGGYATSGYNRNPGIGDLILKFIDKQGSRPDDSGGYATGNIPPNRGGYASRDRDRDDNKGVTSRIGGGFRESLEEEMERHLYLMSRAGYDIVQEEWSDKYKRSINCAHPKGFSQKAHCAGRKKNEDVTTEEKVRLDPKCWSGKKIGNPKTKMKGGVRVNNCVPK